MHCIHRFLFTTRSLQAELTWLVLLEQQVLRLVRQQELPLVLPGQYSPVEAPNHPALPSLEQVLPVLPQGQHQPGQLPVLPFSRRRQQATQPVTTHQSSLLRVSYTFLLVKNKMTNKNSHTYLSKLHTTAITG
jgi:hypothetical protein